jgi:hypothetical protein
LKFARFGPDERLVESSNLGCTNLGEEAVDGVARHAGLIVQFTGAGEHFGSGFSGGGRRRGDAADMRELISLDPAATCWMLRAISRVAAPCCSMAAEMPTVISLICAIVCVMPLIAATASLVDCCTAATWPEISSVAFAVWLASALTSEATTAKPRPLSPARADNRARRGR